MDMFNMVMGKRGSKRGKFSSASKIYGKAAVTSKSYGVDRASKEGKFLTKREKQLKERDKTTPKKEEISEQALNQLASSKNIPVGDLIKLQSPTGVYSSQKVLGQLEKFGQKLKGRKDIEQVKTKKKGGKFYGLDVSGGYRKAGFKFDPRSMSLKSTGWKADVPEEFIKTEKGLYKAPEKKYESYYESETDDETERRYKTYTPTELYLGDDDKLKKVVKRDVYTEKYETESDDDKRRKEKSMGVYEKDINEFFGTGLLKKQERYDIFEKEEKERRRGEREKETEEYEPYLKTQKIYSPGGTVKTERQYSPYKTKYIREKDDGDRDKEEERDIYLKKEKMYTDFGQLMRERDYEKYTKFEERKVSDSGRDKEKRYGTYLGEEKIYGVQDNKPVVAIKRKDIFQPTEQYIDYGDSSTYRDKYEPFLKSEEIKTRDGQKLFKEEYGSYRGGELPFSTGDDYSQIQSRDTAIKERGYYSPEKERYIQETYW